MKINPDCVRDLLLVCEEKLIMDDYGKMPSLSWHNLHKELSKYSLAEIKYTVKYLQEAHIIDAIITFGGEKSIISFKILDITFSGHEYISNIRNTSNWEKVKAKAAHAGVESLKILIEIAKNVAIASITGV